MRVEGGSQPRACEGPPDFMKKSAKRKIPHSFDIRSVFRTFHD